MAEIITYDTWLNLSDDKRKDFIEENKHLEDCSFVVGRDDKDVKTFRSHKFILGGASEVFNKMLNGSFKEAHSSFDIRLPDDEVDLFEMFLQCVYYKKPENLASYSLETLINLIFVGKKYFSSAVEDVIAGNINNYPTDDVVAIFEYLNDEEKNKVIIYRIKTIAAEIDTCPKVYDLTPATFLQLMRLLENRSFEFTRFNMIECYIRMHSSEEPNTSTADNDDSNLDFGTINILRKLINFSKMTAKEFCIGPINSNSLSPRRKLEFLTYLIMHNAKY